MISLSEIVRDSWVAVPGAAAWSAAAWAFGRAAASTIGAEARRQLERRHAATLQEMRRFQADLHRDAQRRRSGTGQADDAPVLSDVDRSVRTAGIIEGMHATRWLRRLDYLLGCPFCLTFWSSALLYVLTLAGGVGELLPTCLAYAVAGVMIDRLAGLQARARKGCATCGKG